MKTVCYLVHDLTDPHVRRRITMLQAAGATVSLVGFRRPWGHTPSDLQVVDLGETQNGALVKRALSVAKAIIGAGRYRRLLTDADVVVARNLEMLAIAAVMSYSSRRRIRIVYESLDVHRSLSGNRPGNRVMRAIENALIRRCALLVTSSPRFITEHFERDGRRLSVPHLVVENKVLALDKPPVEQRVTTDHPPWRIGWYGILRCAKSLAMLTEIALRSGGTIEVLIAGRISYNEMPDFDRIVAETPGLSFLGPYSAPDLANLYGRAHFAWCIDYMEEGQNSSWLLPNRVYEAPAFGAVPIALRNVETGAWLARHGIGMIVAEPCKDGFDRLMALTSEDYRVLLDKVHATPRDALIATNESCRTYLAQLSGTEPTVTDAGILP